MKNLVMGAATGYGWDVLEPFVLSCRKFCPDAEFVLFVDNLSDFTRNQLIQLGVTAEAVSSEPSGIPNNTRWKFFGDYLSEHGENFAQVFITDTRDVIFQGDVFARFNGLTNWLGLTTEADDIGGHRTGDKINYNWLTDCFGKAVADALADKKIICSGTVIGSSREMKIFCRELWKILEHKTSDVFDQAATNYLAWHNLLPVENLIEIDVMSGEIFTGGLVPDIKIRGEKILRGDGGIPAVVHQYDRHKETFQLVDRIYHSKNFQADDRFTDMRSALEQVISLPCR